MLQGVWMTSCREAMGWGFCVIFEKKQLVEIGTWPKRVDFWASARPGQLGLRDAARVVGSTGTVSLVKIVSLAPRVENLKVKKVIKVSYLNYGKSSVFRVFFGFLCRWTFYRSVYFTYSYYDYTTLWTFYRSVYFTYSYYGCYVI